jgi:opacity protein-like surface antigen
MHKVLIACVIILGLSGTLSAQDFTRAEIFGGYSYLNIDTNNLSARQSANGWEASVSGNVNHWFAVEGDVAGYYKGYKVDLTSLGLGTIHVKVSDYSYGAGPRLNYRPFFVHALIGGDHLSGSALGFSASQNSFAGAFGGGVQWKVAPQWAIRGSVDYAITQHNIFGGQAYTQNNVRASVGIVYLFGSGKEPRVQSPRANVPEVTVCQPTVSVGVLGISGCGGSVGFQVDSVHDGSLAERLGIRPGDVIVKIDGAEVRSAVDIESAVGRNSTGTLQVDYLIKATWLTEQQISLR